MQALSLTLSLRRWIACQSMAREARGRGVQVCGRGVREGDAPSPVIHLRLLAAAARERHHDLARIPCPLNLLRATPRCLSRCVVGGATLSRRCNGNGLRAGAAIA